MLTCRHCDALLETSFIDLGHQPPSNAYLKPDALHEPEITFSLRVYVCTKCWLAQLPRYTAAHELFTADYAYFSSTSRSWLDHAKAYVEEMVDRFGLGVDSFVVEVASNDGYLLQYVAERGIRCLGVEPTASTAAAAREKGIETVTVFLSETTGRELAVQYGMADLVPANNVLAHVPDVNDFVRGVAHLLTEQGVATFEFPHLLNLLKGLQFDTIYHEHFSYFSLHAVTAIIAAAGLEVFDIEELSTHGGSLRVFVGKPGAHGTPSERVDAVHQREAEAGITRVEAYMRLQSDAQRIRDDLLTFLIGEKRAGRRVAGYGAAAKGNTLLNYAGVRPDLLPFVCDAAPSKQGRLMPGSHIPILPPSALEENRLDYLLILPWNIADEVRSQLAHLADRDTRFVTAIPELRIR